MVGCPYLAPFRIHQRGSCCDARLFTFNHHARLQSFGCLAAGSISPAGNCLPPGNHTFMKGRDAFLSLRADRRARACKWLWFGEEKIKSGTFLWQAAAPIIPLVVPTAVMCTWTWSVCVCVTAGGQARLRGAGPSSQEQLSAPLRFLVTVATLGEQTWMKIKEQREEPGWCDWRDHFNSCFHKTFLKRKQEH